MTARDIIDAGDNTFLFPNAARFLNGLPMANENFAMYAGVSDEIFNAFVKGEQGLTYQELFKALEHADPVSYDAMIYPKIIYLDPKRRRHRLLVEDIKRRALGFLDADASEGFFRSDMQHWDSYFKTWFDEFERGNATYSGYKIRLAYLNDLQQSLNASIKKAAKRRVMRRGQTETIPEGKRVLKPERWCINVEANTKPFSDVTMYSSGTCSVFVAANTLEEAFKECERVRETTLEDKERKYLEKGIYDEFV